MEYITEFLWIAGVNTRETAVSGLNPFGAMYVGVGRNQFVTSCGQ